MTSSSLSSLPSWYKPSSVLLPLATPYNIDPDIWSNSNGLKCEDVSLTRQDDAIDADINVIVGRFLATGEMPQGVKVPQFGDFSDATDYKTSLDQVRAAEQAFAQFPAEVRNQYQNNVGLFLDAAYAGQVPGVDLSSPDKQNPTPPAADVAASAA